MWYNKLIKMGGLPLFLGVERGGGGGGGGGGRGGGGGGNRGAVERVRWLFVGVVLLALLLMWYSGLINVLARFSRYPVLRLCHADWP